MMLHRSPDVGQEVIQAAVSAFPTHTPEDLTTLQEADPAISAFLRFWKIQRHPDQIERANLSPQVLELFRQRSKVVQPRAAIGHLLASRPNQVLALDFSLL